MRDYSLDYLAKNITTKSKSSSFKFKAIIPLAVFLIIVSILIFLKLKNNFHSQSNTYIVQNEATKNEEMQKKVEGAKTSKTQEFLQKLENEVASGGGTYSLYIYDINNQKEYGINEQMVLTAASVNKIPILASLYHLAGKGEIDLEKVITTQKRDIQDYGTGTIRYDPVGTNYSLKTLARLMMEKSDNTAAYILASQIMGLKKIQQLIDSWELIQTDITNNKSSTKDMAILLIKMYKGEITNNSLTAEMLGFMDKSDFDDRIPAGLPSGVKVYHKTGDEVGKIHDVGIVELPNRPYYLGIFTLDMTDDTETKKKLANISRMVFEFMKSL